MVLGECCPPIVGTVVIITPESMTALGSSGEMERDSTNVWVRMSCWSSSSCSGESVAWESSLSE